MRCWDSRNTLRVAGVVGVRGGRLRGYSLADSGLMNVYG